jgi:hypothetical protein
MKHIRVMLADRLRSGNALKSGNLLPEMVQHRIRGRVPIVSPPMHLTSRDDVDPRRFLFQNRSLRRTKLGIREIGRRDFAQGD